MNWHIRENLMAVDDIIATCWLITLFFIALGNLLHKHVMSIEKWEQVWTCLILSRMNTVTGIDMVVSSPCTAPKAWRMWVFFRNCFEVSGLNEYINLTITLREAKGIVYTWVRVCVSLCVCVCLYVCLLAKIEPSQSTDLHETWYR